MPKYQCPECQAVLRRAEAIPLGKKIRCPKCEIVFAAKPMAEEEPILQAGYAVAGVTAPPPPKPKPAVDEDEDGNPYGVIKEEEGARPEIHLGSLRDRFAKSAIGPAMYKTVVPSNWLLRLGLFSCVVAVCTFAFGVFPIIFCEATPLRPFIRPRVNIMLQATVMFILGSIMCTGASKMHDLTSYPLAIIGSIMSVFIYVPIGIFMALLLLVMFGPLGLIPVVIDGGLSLVGIWCIIVLLNPAVREGFRERAEEISTE